VGISKSPVPPQFEGVTKDSSEAKAGKKGGKRSNAKNVKKEAMQEKK